MEVKADPAGRLHDLLESARKQAESKRAREALDEVFDVENQVG